MASEATGVSGIAGRYATALYELADQAKSLDDVAQDLRDIKAMLQGSDELSRFVRSPLIDRDDQTAGILAVAAEAKVGDLTRRFLGVGGKNRRLFALGAIVDAFLKELAARRGEVTASVTSATPLSEEQMTAVTEALKAAVGGKVVVEQAVDPELIGGLVVRVGSRMVDTSIRTQLQRMQRSLRAAG